MEETKKKYIVLLLLLGITAVVCIVIAVRNRQIQPSAASSASSATESLSTGDTEDTQTIQEELDAEGEWKTYQKYPVTTAEDLSGMEEGTDGISGTLLPVRIKNAEKIPREYRSQVKLEALKQLVQSDDYRRDLYVENVEETDTGVKVTCTFFDYVDSLPEYLYIEI